MADETRRPDREEVDEADQTQLGKARRSIEEAKKEVEADHRVAETQQGSKSLPLDSPTQHETGHST